MAHHEAHGHDSGILGHVVPVKLLVGVWITLMILTVITVAVRYVDLGELNLIMALAIATVKAALVVGFFMHLHWDNKFNSLVFLSSLLALALFLGFALMDSGEYQQDIRTLVETQAAAK